MAWWLAQNVVVTAALALVVAVACRLLRVGPVARHALWVLVLIKFITPPLVVWPWALPDPLGLSVASRAIESESTVESSGVRELLTVNSLAPAASADSAGLATQPIEAAHFDPTAWLLAIWIAGSVFLLLLEGVRIWRLRQRVLNGAQPDLVLDERVRQLARILSVGNVPVRVVEGISSPMVWAAGRPQLLWPADLPSDSSDACVDGLIVHELAHIRRRDHVIGWIELAAGVLWWWNPLFWFVRASRREQAELACDAWVISVLPNGRRAYAESLLALSGAAVRGAPSMAVVGIRATSRRVLERRLVMIMKGSTPLRLPLMGIAGLAFAAAMTLPAWAMSPAQVATTAPPTQVATTAPQTQAPPPPPPATPPTLPAQVQPQPKLPVKTEPSVVVAVEPNFTIPPVPVSIAATVPARSQNFTVAVQPTIATKPMIAIPSHSFVGVPQQAVPPPPAPAVAASKSRDVRVAKQTGDVPKLVWKGDALPADGQQLLKQFEADADQIRKDTETRIATRRQSLIKQLEDLQEQYTKAGKLDEAIAVRNYLRGVKGAR